MRDGMVSAFEWQRRTKTTNTGDEMKTTRTTYRVETVHPTGYMNGTHELTVSTTKDNQRNRYIKSVSGKGFGCSRDYETPLDSVAISNLLLENGMRAVRIEKVS